MRIALISEHASPLAAPGGTDSGGQNVYVANVAACLARLGHHVDVLTRRDAPSLPGVVEMEPRLRVIHVPAGPAAPVAKEEMLPLMAAFTAASVQLFRQSEPYDVVHANFFMSGLVGLRLKALLGTPLVMTYHALGLVRREHQGAADGFPPERVAIERRIAQVADRVVAECPQDESDLQRLYGVPAERLAMVPCGVDLAEFGARTTASRRRARRQLGLGEDEFVVLQLGRMVPRKGVDNVIQAVAQMDRSRPVRLLVVGGNSASADESATPEIGRLRTIAAECGLAAAVTFTGQRPRSALRTCYHAADVFVSTPWYEPFGITPLEAMACGLPVIGSAVGGIRYSVVDGITGFLVPPRAPHVLAQRLEQLRADPSLAAALGRAGARRVRSRFTWDRVTEELVDVYRAAAVPVEHERPVYTHAPSLRPLARDLAHSLPWSAEVRGHAHEPG